MNHGSLRSLRNHRIRFLWKAWQYELLLLHFWHLKYWEEEQFLVDYLLTDYLIVLAQRHDSYIDQAFKQIKPNNPMCDELFKVLDEPYDALKWKALTKDTDLFKLTWKQQFKTSSNHQEIFLGKIFKQ